MVLKCCSFSGHSIYGLDKDNQVLHRLIKMLVGIRTSTTKVLNKSIKSQG